MPYVEKRIYSTRSDIWTLKSCKKASSFCWKALRGGGVALESLEDDCDARCSFVSSGLDSGFAFSVAGGA
jgi:hypothetical protein